MVDQSISNYFNEIYERTFKNTIRYITTKCSRSVDIADICQEVYMEVYDVLLRKGIRYINNPDAFVAQIAKVKVYRHYSLIEKIKGVSFIESTLENEEDLGSYTIDDGIITKELVDSIVQHIKTKKDDVIRIFYLYYYVGLKIDEIAVELDISESNVKNKLYRTVRELRELYGKDE